MHLLCITLANTTYSFAISICFINLYMKKDRGITFYLPHKHARLRHSYLLYFQQFKIIAHHKCIIIFMTK
ncbi:hypothetical protein BS412_10255 [Cronobacter turicensis]|uniref:Uncharacterized protein n=1 Tax=Cronobacter turicensis TaxID=413502 RepID=A0A2T7B9L9_9ENTR|nr:hypothetical protein BS411_02490 [Cronobacter turicensis]PUX36242.1 hypothetical protein BS412_10255 [Cronobacter turicensis]